MRCMLALLLVAVVSGCTRLEHPIVAAEGPALDPALVGDWELTNEKGSMRLAISSDGNAGALVMTTVEGDEDPKVERFRLITAQLERRSYASVQSIDPDDDSKGAWFYCIYETPTRDLLLVRNSSSDAWADAVTNGMVSGRIETNSSGKQVIVTASDAELRTFVLGYDRVLFSDEELGEFRRVELKPGD
jgi:hypothetical protein